MVVVVSKDVQTQHVIASMRICPYLVLAALLKLLMKGHDPSIFPIQVHLNSNLRMQVGQIHVCSIA